MTQPFLAPTATCECAALGVLDPVLRRLRATSGHLVALNDEGMLCVVDTWPHDCTGKACWGHAWADDDWSDFLESFAAYGPRPHVTADGRAMIPVVEEGLLWGAMVVDPGEGCPHSLAEAVSPHVSSLTHAVRGHAS